MAFRWIGKSVDGNTVTLKRLAGCSIQTPAYATNEWIKVNTDQIRSGAVLDIETTGLNKSEDVIIEIAIQQFDFNRTTGEILRVLKSYVSFQDPGLPIPSKITDITGITNEMVAGKHISWNEVDSILESCSLIISHNARFDRPFIDKNSKVSAEKIWACSIKNIDWAAKGFSSSKLELLNIYHGFFTDSHRATNDVEALVYLISQRDPQTERPYLLELITNARRPMTQIIASGASFESKDRLKDRGYSWDATNRFWSKTIYKDELPGEINWMESDVYFGAFAGINRDIPLKDLFKN